MRVNHFILRDMTSVAADAIERFDLGVNPLSLILLKLSVLNETSTLGNFARFLTLVDAINRVEVLLNGSGVVSCTGRDLVALNFKRRGWALDIANQNDTDNERRTVVLPICLGRAPYDVESCFPATERGELSMRLDLDVASAGYDGLQYGVECVELLGAKPKEFERTVEYAATPASTGNFDLDLPIGNVLRGALLFGTTAYTGAAPAPSWGKVSVRANNTEHFVSSSDFEVQAVLHGLRHGGFPFDDHIHRVDASSASATEATVGPIQHGQSGLANYAYMDFDPTRDDQFAIDSKGLSQFSVRGDIETADAVRVLPVERVQV